MPSTLTVTVWKYCVVCVGKTWSAAPNVLCPSTTLLLVPETSRNPNARCGLTGGWPASACKICVKTNSRSVRLKVTTAHSLKQSEFRKFRAAGAEATNGPPNNSAVRAAHLRRNHQRVVRTKAAARIRSEDPLVRSLADFRSRQKSLGLWSRCSGAGSNPGVPKKKRGPPTLQSTEGFLSPGPPQKMRRATAFKSLVLLRAFSRAEPLVSDCARATFGKHRSSDALQLWQ